MRSQSGGVAKLDLGPIPDKQVGATATNAHAALIAIGADIADTSAAVLGRLRLYAANLGGGIHGALTPSERPS